MTFELVNNNNAYKLKGVTKIKVWDGPELFDIINNHIYFKHDLVNYGQFLNQGEVLRFMKRIVDPLN